MLGIDNTVYTGKVKLFENLEFKYIINKPIINHSKLDRQPTYVLVDNDKLKPLEVEISFKYNLEQRIKNYINDNISKLPFETDKYLDVLNFDYKAVPNRLEDIKQIDSVDILYSSINMTNPVNPVLELNINVMYVKLNGEITRLLPKQYKPLTFEVELEKIID